MFYFSNLTSKLLQRSLDYVKRIDNFSLDGNLATATVHGTFDYEVMLEVDFLKGTINHPKCTCPYSNEHRQCKHIVSLAFYLSILFNCLDLNELIKNEEANILYRIVHVFSVLKIDLSIDKINEIVNRLKNEEYFSALDLRRLLLIGPIDVNSINVNSALNHLLSNNFIRIENGFVYVTGNFKILDTYVSFLTSLYFSYNEDDDYFDDEEDEDIDSTYDYSKQYLINEINKQGIDIKLLGSLIQEKSYGKNEFDDGNPVNYFFIKDKKLVCELLENNREFYSENFIKLPSYKMSPESLAYFVRTYCKKDDQEYFIELIKRGKFRDFYLSIKNSTKSLKDKFSNFQENYYIGKAIEFCLKEDIVFFFS